jgi:hypothetical protein
MTGLVRVPILRGVATADLAARHASPQGSHVSPMATHCSQPSEFGTTSRVWPTCVHGRPEPPRGLWTANLMFDRKPIFLPKRYIHGYSFRPASRPALLAAIVPRTWSHSCSQGKYRPQILTVAVQRCVDFRERHQREVRRKPLPRLYAKSSNTGEAPRHKANHGSVHQRFATRTQPLVVFAHPTLLVDPCQCPLHPSPRQHHEAFVVHKDVTLRLPLTFLPPSKPLSSPPTAVLFTDWLSTIPALG